MAPSRCTTRRNVIADWSRRDMLRGSAAAIMGISGLAPRYGLAADIPYEYDGSKFQVAAPEPNPKRGGVLRPSSPVSIRCCMLQRIRARAPAGRGSSRATPICC